MGKSPNNPSRVVVFPFPIKGWNTIQSRNQQPEQTSPDLLNVVAFDTNEARARGGQRPGTVNVTAFALGNPLYLRAWRCDGTEEQIWVLKSAVTPPVYFMYPYPETESSHSYYIFPGATETVNPTGIILDEINPGALGENCSAVGEAGSCQSFSNSLANSEFVVTWDDIPVSNSNFPGEPANNMNGVVMHFAFEGFKESASTDCPGDTRMPVWRAPVKHLDTNDGKGWIDDGTGEALIGPSIECYCDGGVVRWRILGSYNWEPGGNADNLAFTPDPTVDDPRGYSSPAFTNENGSGTITVGG